MTPMSLFGVICCRKSASDARFFGCSSEIESLSSLAVVDETFLFCGVFGMTFEIFFEDGIELLDDEVTSIVAKG